MIGQKFGLLTVISPAGTSSSGNRYWHCQCECGNTTKARGDKLKAGQRKSCGCKPRGRWSGVLMWSKELVAEKAKLCITKREFREQYPNEYSAAVRHKWLKEVGSHLKGCQTPSKPKPLRVEHISNAIYIWKALGCLYEDTPIYKIGVTSAKYNARRISTVAKKAGVDHEIVILMQVQDCRSLEKALLSIGTPIPSDMVNGSIEFRAMTAIELNEAIELIFASIRKNPIKIWTTK